MTLAGSFYLMIQLLNICSLLKISIELLTDFFLTTLNWFMTHQIPWTLFKISAFQFLVQAASSWLKFFLGIALEDVKGRLRTSHKNPFRRGCVGLGRETVTRMARRQWRHTGSLDHGLKYNLTKALKQEKLSLPLHHHYIMTTSKDNSRKGLNP